VLAGDCSTIAHQYSSNEMEVWLAALVELDALGRLVLLTGAAVLDAGNRAESMAFNFDQDL